MTDVLLTTEDRLHKYLSAITRSLRVKDTRQRKFSFRKMTSMAFMCFQ